MLLENHSFMTSNMVLCYLASWHIFVPFISNSKTELQSLHWVGDVHKQSKNVAYVTVSFKLNIINMFGSSIRLRTEVPCTPSSASLGLELMTSRSCQYISCVTEMPAITTRPSVTCQDVNKNKQHIIVLQHHLYSRYLHSHLTNQLLVT